VLAVAVFSHINIGVRHILPVYTGFALVAGAGAVYLWRIGAQHAWARYALPGALLWFGGTSLAAHPDYLPYFNELAGSHPENILVDSDLDWGQDYKRLAARLDELGARQVTFSPFPMTLLERHGFPHVTPLTPLAPMAGWNAIGVSTWKERRLNVADPRVQADPWMGGPVRADGEGGEVDLPLVFSAAGVEPPVSTTKVGPIISPPRLRERREKPDQTL
jgi:hypothetical protein